MPLRYILQICKQVQWCFAVAGVSHHLASLMTTAVIELEVRSAFYQEADCDIIVSKVVSVTMCSQWESS